MSCRGCKNFSACSLVGVLISAIFGAIVGVLFAFGFIPGIVTAAWIAFGLGVLAFILLVVGVYLAAVTSPNALSRCLSKQVSCLLAGIIGTIVTALAALSIVLTPVFISVITLVAIAAFFFALMIIGLIALILCIKDK